LRYRFLNAGLQGADVFRFSIREMLWLTLVVALMTGWGLESHRSRQWRQRAEITAGQLEAEYLGRMVFGDKTAVFHSLHYDAPLRESVYYTGGE
jgi:hypothetical protein